MPSTEYDLIPQIVKSNTVSVEAICMKGTIDVQFLLMENDKWKNKKFSGLLNAEYQSMCCIVRS